MAACKVPMLSELNVVDCFNYKISDAQLIVFMAVYMLVNIQQGVMLMRFLSTVLLVETGLGGE